MGHLYTRLTQGFMINPNIKLKIAVLGAPGSGKSTLAAGLLYFSKIFQFKVDSVPEVAKWHIYKGTNFKDALFEYQKFKEQKDLEDIYPEALQITICEAPLIISAIYSSYYRGEQDKVTKDMMTFAQQNKNRYTHFLVTRNLTPFETFGRNETIDQAEALHQVTLQILERLNLNYTVINRYDDHIPLQILLMVGAIRKQSLDEETLKTKGRASLEDLQGQEDLFLH